MKTFDLSAPGKTVYDLADIIPGDPFPSDIVCCINNGEGPSVILCGGIHGDEYEPQIVIRRMIETLDVSDVTGRLVLIPSINPPASSTGNRISPDDWQNMNRVFPGDASGTPTERLAAFMNDSLFGKCDLLVDVHSGGGDYRVVPMIFGFTSDACKITDDELEKVMADWDYPFIQYVNGIASTSAGRSPIAGTASVEIEGGSGGDVTAQELSTMHDGIVRGLNAFGVLSGEPAGASRKSIRVTVGAGNQHPAPRDGLLEHMVSLGSKVDEGDLIAMLHPVVGAEQADLEIRANGPGYVLRQRARAFVRKDELVANTGTLRPPI